ncbi:MAG: TonB-dependent receptor [Acidobacteria bacterium]|nr:TonB-dependent receptor [Acidobacteriota bacterium]
MASPNERALRILTASAFALTVAASAAAQTTGDIRGQVRDANGDGLPGVMVTATIEDRGVSRTTIAGVGGSFVISSLQVDDYVVTAALDGFRDHRVEGVRVGIAATVNLEIVLSLEAVEEEVTVTASPILDVTSSSVGTSFTADFIDDLPTDRNFWDLVAVSPGISQASEGSTSLSAFGSSVASNSWRIDGLDTTSSDTGRAFWWTNPAIIEEVQVLGIGAPAEYGSMSGAAINIVTKSGTNEFTGTVDWYHMNDGLTEENAEIDGLPFHREEFDDLTGTLGGPLARDKAWFFASIQSTDDAYADPGVDPSFPTAYPTVRSDIKINAAFNDSNLMEAKYHFEDYDFVFAAPNTTPDAIATEFGNNPAWGLQFQSVLTPNDYLEVLYTGYSSDDNLLSATGSTAAPYADYSPADDGPTQYSGSPGYTYIWLLGRDQLDVKLSHHADDLLGGDHDFKFGISYGTGSGDTRTGGGPNGVYYYRYQYPGYYYAYYYRVTARPFYYGAETAVASAFVDDSWQVNSNLTLNVGVRYDKNNGDIPDYPELNPDWSPTSEIIPGVKDVTDWSLVSPRVGMAYQLGDRQVLRAFYGKFYDADVTGHWYAPPPRAPDYIYEYSLSLDGPWTYSRTFEYHGNLFHPNLQPPETDQFTLGWERRLGDSFTFGIQGVYKEAKNLIGWEILDDGVTERVPWTNPITGETEQLISILEQPTTRKGNGPGPGSAAPGRNYHQQYEGVVFSFNKRYSDGWSMQSSYTWSDSSGFLPRPLQQSQGNPFYAEIDGRDPNNWINADQALQNDREHVFQFQGSFELPWKILGSATYSYMTGKPYNRQLLVGGRASPSPLAQGQQTVIAVPASDDTRLPDQNNFDLSFGRRFDLGRAQLKLDLQLLNVFNEDTYDWWEELTVAPDEEFVPSGYLFPRRVMIRFGFEF